MLPQVTESTYFLFDNFYITFIFLFAKKYSILLFFFGRKEGVHGIKNKNLQHTETKDMKITYCPRDVPTDHMVSGLGLRNP